VNTGVGSEFLSYERAMVPNSPNNSVCTLSDHILYVILFGNIEGDLAIARGIRRSRHDVG
jgi:hypothetical protein